MRLVVMYCVMGFTMGLEFLFPVKRFWTEVTLEPGFSRMDPHVRLHVAFLVEPFGTKLALKGFFSRVGENVLFKLLLLMELFLTMATGVECISWEIR